MLILSWTSPSPKQLWMCSLRELRMIWRAVFEMITFSNVRKAYMIPFPQLLGPWEGGLRVGLGEKCAESSPSSSPPEPTFRKRPT